MPLQCRPLHRSQRTRLRGDTSRLAMAGTRTVLIVADTILQFDTPTHRPAHRQEGSVFRQAAIRLWKADQPAVSSNTDILSPMRQSDHEYWHVTAEYSQCA